MRVVLAVFLPLLVLLGWTGWHGFVAKHGVEVELPIKGYDPRDLLSGHYLIFQVDYGTPVCPTSASFEQRCVCLSRGGGGPSVATWHGACDERLDCEAWIQGTCESSRFVAGIERFYFADEHTTALAVVPPEATIKVRLDGRGGAQVDALLVEGRPLGAWLEEKARAAAAP